MRRLRKLLLFKCAAFAFFTMFNSSTLAFVELIMTDQEPSFRVLINAPIDIWDSFDQNNTRLIEHALPGEIATVTAWAQDIEQDRNYLQISFPDGRRGWTNLPEQEWREMLPIEATEASTLYDPHTGHITENSIEAGDFVHFTSEEIIGEAIAGREGWNFLYKRVIVHRGADTFEGWVRYEATDDIDRV